MKSNEERINDLEKLVASSIEDNRAIRSSISNGFKKIEENFTFINKHFNIIYNKLDDIDKKIVAFSGKTNKNLKDVNIHLVSIKEEITKINKVTKYEEEHNNLLKLIKGASK